MHGARVSIGRIGHVDLAAIEEHRWLWYNVKRVQNMFVNEKKKVSKAEFDPRLRKKHRPKRGVG